MLGIDYSLFGARVLHLGEDLSILNSQGLEFKIISSGAKVDRNILPQKKKSGEKYAQNKSLGWSQRETNYRDQLWKIA